MNLTEEFLDNVKNHKMKILLDSGVYRHLYFRSPESINRYFEIVTYPGYLVICGDMGTYVFRRLSDMFEFFRHDTVDLDYWSQKIDAEDKNSKVREFSPEKAKERVLEIIDQYFEDSDEEQGLGLEKLNLKAEVSSFGYESEEDFRYALEGMDFEGFSDMWEVSFKDYTFHFIWCCQAIVWAIKQWDAREKV